MAHEPVRGLGRLQPLIKPCIRFSRTRLSDVLHRKGMRFRPSGGGGKLVEAMASVQVVAWKVLVATFPSPHLVALAQVRAQALFGVPFDPPKDPRAVAVVAAGSAILKRSAMVCRTTRGCANVLYL